MLLAENALFYVSPFGNYIYVSKHEIVRQTGFSSCSPSTDKCKVVEVLNQWPQLMIATL